MKPAHRAGFVSSVLVVLLWLAAFAFAAETTTGGRVVLEADALLKAANGIALSGDWKYHPGNDPEWARPELDDTGWENAPTLLPQRDLPRAGWTGIGWFRLHLTLDPALVNVPLALRVWQLGASEIYVNGSLVLAYGKVGLVESETEGSYDHDPKVVSFDGTEQVLAVRYANFVADERVSPSQRTDGFSLTVGEANRLLARSMARVRSARTTQMLVVGVAATIALLHLLLAVFYPARRENLHYAIFAAGLALMTFVIIEYELSMAFSRYVLLCRVETPLMVLTLLSGIRFEYSLLYASPPRRFWIFFASGLLFGAVYAIEPLAWKIPLFVWGLVGMVEMVRIVVVAVARKRGGAWILAIGFLMLTLAGVYQMLVFLGLLPWSWPSDGFVVGILGLVVSMSVYLAREFARTNRELLASMRMGHELEIQQLEAQKLRELDEVKSRLFANLSCTSVSRSRDTIA